MAEHRLTRSGGIRRAATLAAAGGLGALAVAVLPADGTASTSNSFVGPSAPTSTVSWRGRVLERTVARRAPRPGARRVKILKPTAPFAGGGTTLLITGVKSVDGTPWAEVLLPVRPNGRRGWVPLESLKVSQNKFRISIDLSSHRLTLYRSGKPVRRVRVAVGKPGTPTPVGNRFAVAENIRTNQPGHFLGPVVFALTGYSETLNEFAGGNGRLALHGTSVPRLLGTAASHGCVRMSNRDVLALSRVVRAGTPVSIRR